MDKKKNKNQIALAGEYATLSQLALHEFDASMTLGNTKSIDILINKPGTNKFIRMEVKTTTQKKEKYSGDFGKVYEWTMNAKHEEIRDNYLFYCFVKLADDYKNHKFFIVPAKIVAQYVKKEHKFWLKGKSHKKNCIKRKNNEMRTFRLGFKDYKENKGYKIEKTPLVETYENRWDYLK